MNEPTMLTPTDEQAVRAAGAAWCSEETFARIWATLDAAREELRLMTADRDENATVCDLVEALAARVEKLETELTLAALSAEVTK